jgi:hypothetical protein
LTGALTDPQPMEDLPPGVILEHDLTPHEG